MQITKTNLFTALIFSIVILLTFNFLILFRTEHNFAKIGKCFLEAQKQFEQNFQAQCLKEDKNKNCQVIDNNYQQIKEQLESYRQFCINLNS
jgi:hypothetical protein